VGVIKVEGSFNKGDTVRVYSPDNRLIAKGISNFSDEALEKIRGRNDKQILKEHGLEFCCEVIHRDSLVVFNENDYE
jgi:glutamate 5-kinase